MTIGLTLLLFLAGVCINIIITVVLIIRNKISDKLVREIQFGVHGLLNELHNTIALAEDKNKELTILVKKAEIMNDSAVAASPKNISYSKETVFKNATSENNADKTTSPQFSNAHRKISTTKGKDLSKSNLSKSNASKSLKGQKKSSKVDEFFETEHDEAVPNKLQNNRSDTKSSLIEIAEKDKKELIKIMLDQNNSIDTIIRTLQVSYDEVNLIKAKLNNK